MEEKGAKDSWEELEKRPERAARDQRPETR